MKSGLRLRSVRFKSGAPAITVFRDKRRDADRARIIAHAMEVFAIQGEDVAGYAIVVWSGNGTSTADIQVTERSRIPSIMVPDFIRNRLLAQRIETWTIESLNGK